jgi:hypothetical protein
MSKNWQKKQNIYKLKTWKNKVGHLKKNHTTFGVSEAGIQGHKNDNNFLYQPDIFACDEKKIQQD